MKATEARAEGFFRKWTIPHLSLGLLLVSLIVVASISSVFLPEGAYLSMDIGRRLEPPGFQHLLGTDQYGRDIFARLLVGSRYSVVVGLFAVGIGIGLGVPLGCAAGYFEGWGDSLLSRTMDIVYGFPPVITAVLVTAVLGPGLRNAIIAIGLFNVAIFARLARGNFLSVKERDYVVAARSTGRSELALILGHILPNIGSPIIIQASSQFAFAILSEAALSYLGMGIQPPNPSWGLMLSQAQSFVRLSPWPVVFPGLAIMSAVLGFNLTGDGLRDLFDPVGRR